MDASLLAKVDLFKTLSPESLAEIAAVTKQLNVGASQRVVKIGDVAREMFFVLSGTLSVVDAEGSELRVLQAGTFFGELGLIYNIPRTVNVIAKSALQLCVLQKADFDTLRDRCVSVSKHDLSFSAQTLQDRRCGRAKEGEERFALFLSSFLSVAALFRAILRPGTLIRLGIY